MTADLNQDTVTKAYTRWAPVYDLVFGAVESTMTWYDDEHDLRPDAIAEAVASAAVRGILGRPPSPQRLRQAGDRLLAARPVGRLLPSP